MSPRSSRVRPRPLRVVRFVLDVHLGRLARLLRLAGFDSLYANDWDDRDLSRLSRQEGRILLTRDRGLLMRAEVTHGYCVRSPHPPAQLSEVIARFDLSRASRPFSLCLVCNRHLAAPAAAPGPGAGAPARGPPLPALPRLPPLRPGVLARQPLGAHAALSGALRGSSP